MGAVRTAFTRLNNAVTALNSSRAAIRTALVNKGVSASGHDFGDFAADINNIVMGVPVPSTVAVGDTPIKQFTDIKTVAPGQTVDLYQYTAAKGGKYRVKVSGTFDIADYSIPSLKLYYSTGGSTWTQCGQTQSISHGKLNVTVDCSSAVPAGATLKITAVYSGTSGSPEAWTILSAAICINWDNSF